VDDVPFEIWEDPSGHVRFYFSYVSKSFSTGAIVMASDSELPRHHRPAAFENLVQLAGVSQLSLTDESGEVQHTYELRPGTAIRMQKGQWHIHANPYDEESVTQFFADGDITDIIETVRHRYTKIDPQATE